MPVGNPVSATEALARGLRTTFVDTYQRLLAEAHPLLKKVMDLGLPSDKSSELYAYFESSPHPTRWPRGEDIPADAFRARNWTVENYDWAKKVSWHSNDEADDQTKSLVDRVRDVAGAFQILPERIFFQVLTGSVDLDLLPVVPTAPDGAALFATTAGGAARFGVTGGNIVTGTGVATVAAVHTDLYGGIARFLRMQDTEGQPLWPPELVGRGITIVYGSANELVFRQAFSQMNHVQIVQNVAAAENVAAAAPSNVVLNSGLRFNLWSSPRILDNDWFVFLDGGPKKAIFEQVREPLQDDVEDFGNSDRTRSTKMKSIQWHARMGYGVSLPYQAIQINN